MAAEKIMATQTIDAAVANLYRFELEWEKKVAEIAEQRASAKTSKKMNFCELNNLAAKVLESSSPQSTLIENMPVLSHMSKETCTERHKMYFECAIIYGTYKKREEELVNARVEEILKEKKEKKEK